MKKFIFVSALALFTSASVLIAQAPQQRDPAERAKMTIERLKPELTLTDQQQKDMTPVYTDFYKGMQDLMQKGQPAPEDRKKLVDQRDEKLKKILSEDQMKKLAEAEEKMRQQRKQGGGNQ